MESLQRIFRYSTDWRAEEAFSFVFQGRRYYKGQIVKAHVRGISRRHRMLVYLDSLWSMEAEDADTDVDAQGRP